jgi:hypothetical protein
LQGGLRLQAGATGHRGLMRVLGIRISTIDLRRRNGAISQNQVVSRDGQVCKNYSNEKPSNEV